MELESAVKLQPCSQADQQIMDLLRFQNIGNLTD